MLAFFPVFVKNRVLSWAQDIADFRSKTKNGTPYFYFHIAFDLADYKHQKCRQVYPDRYKKTLAPIQSGRGLYGNDLKRSTLQDESAYFFLSFFRSHLEEINASSKPFWHFYLEQIICCIKVHGMYYLPLGIGYLNL